MKRDPRHIVIQYCCAYRDCKDEVRTKILACLCALGSAFALLHSSFDAPASEAGRDFLTGLNLFGIFDQVSVRVKHQGVTAVEDGDRGKSLETPGEVVDSGPSM